MKATELVTLATYQILNYHPDKEADFPIGEYIEQLKTLAQVTQFPFRLVKKILPATDSYFVTVQGIK
jgi:hypothetical protein